MIAIVAGFFLVSYLLGPGAIYRLAFSLYLPSKRLQRSRPEEIVFSAIVTVIPLVIAWCVLLHMPIGRYPHLKSDLDKTASYRLVLTSLVSDSAAKSPLLPSAYSRSVAEQLRFISLLWVLCWIEGAYAGYVVSKYGDYQDRSKRKWVCDKFLLKHVSEWQFLFTTLSLKRSIANTRDVEVDVLSADILYRGRLVNWFTDIDGKLAGIFIEKAARYRRTDLERDRAADKILPVESYWREIPGARMYIPASTVANYNIRYAPRTQQDVISEELGPDVTVKLISSSNDGELLGTKA